MELPLMQEKQEGISLKLQYLEELRKAAYLSFNDRRSYEWKLSLAIWTALAIVIVGLAQQKLQDLTIPGTYFKVVAVVIGLLIIVVHVYFNNGMARANAIDKTRFQDYSRQIESMLEITRDPKLQKMIGELPSTPNHRWLQWWQWGHLAQIAITLLLTAVTVSLVWLRTS